MPDDPEPVAAEDAEATQPQTMGERQGAPRHSPDDSHTGVMVLIFWMAVALVYMWVSHRDILLKYWWVPTSLVGIGIVLLLISPIRRWLAEQAARRITLMLGFAVPLVVMVVFLPETWQGRVLRLLFLAAVSLFPGIMYYLFVSSAKSSLLNEFIRNLDRLGLLTPSQSTSEDDWLRRIQTYLQKFESFYGPLPSDLRVELASAPGQPRLVTVLRSSWKAQWRGASLFTTETTIPLVFATILITLGWVLVLPPLPDMIPSGSQGAPVSTVPGPVPARSRQEGLVSAVPTPRPATWTRPLTSPVGFAAAQSPPPQAPSPGAGSPPEGKAAGPQESSRARSLLRSSVALSPEPTPVNFAFLGAYFFGLQMLFRRFVRRDLRANAFVAIALRIVLAVIGTWVVVAIAHEVPFLGPVSNETFLLLGFVIGVFPRIAWQLVQAAFKKLAGFVLPSLQTQLPISDLDGLTVWHEARLEEEDIENVPNMATADIAELMLQTRIPPERIVDWVDQAILYTHLGPDNTPSGQQSPREILRKYGIRTASALKYANAQIAPASLAGLLAGEAGAPSIVLTLIKAMETNSNLSLIHAWRGQNP